MKTDTHILNSLAMEAGDGVLRWMHVCPFGEHPWSSADGKERIVQVIDREGCEAMAAHYPLSVPNSRIDIDHESMDNDKRTAAVGWGQRAEVRDDGLWVLTEFNPEGAALVNGKVYKFSSPCFPREGLLDLGGGRFRVTRLSVIALTNDPNLRGQKPLTNRRAQSANPNTNIPTHMDYKAELLKLLGLPPDATDDQIANGCAAHKSKTDAMNSRVTELEIQLVNRDLDEHGITDTEQRKLLTPMLANKDQRTAALAIMARGKAAAAPAAPLHNRQGAPVPGTDKTLSAGAAPDASAEAEQKRADWIGNRAKELKAAKPERPHRDCFAQAESEYNVRA